MSDQTLTEDEKVEAELGEQARIASDTWGSVAPGKADNFKASFTRMLGLLSPDKLALAVVTLMGTAGVVLTVIAPKILGRATDVVFAGAISRLPVWHGVTTQADAVAGLRAAGQGRLADLVAGLDHFVPGAGIDFNRLGQLLLVVLALYVGAALLTWAQGFIINIVMVRAMWRLREQVEEKINRLPLGYFDRSIPSFNPGSAEENVTKIELTRDGRTVVVARSAPASWKIERISSAFQPNASKNATPFAGPNLNGD